MVRRENPSTKPSDHSTHSSRKSHKLTVVQCEQHKRHRADQKLRLSSRTPNAFGGEGPRTDAN
jgi:hypothetical protein